MIYIVFAAFSFSLFADTAWFPIGKEGANLNYSEKQTCEKEEGQECYNIGECPLDECEFVTEITQDDLGINVETKVLKNSEAKKAQLQAEKQAEKDLEESKIAAKKALKQSIKNDIKDANTVAKLKALIEKMIEANE